MTKDTNITLFCSEYVVKIQQIDEYWPIVWNQTLIAFLEHVITTSLTQTSLWTLKPTLGYVCEHFFENDTKLHNDLGVNSWAYGLQFNNHRATLNLELLDAYYVVYI
mgnify:FL=1